ncbi:MAG: PSD1 and planctomycete cytochrome C domain-containing protein [Bacteroidota bacterium]|jgi:hypothetical protein
MPIHFKSPVFLSISIATSLSLVYFLFLHQPQVDYNADVKPILNQKCISCHGGVKKKGGFSLLFQEEALSPTESGKPAIIAGDAQNSEMIKRLYAKDLDERMPYHEEELSDEEKKILERWIDQGAKFSTHWAYLPVQKTTVPSGGFFEFIKKKDGTEIDRFIDQELDEVGLNRSNEADKKTLLRRVALDLIGMPAPSQIQQSFLNDSSVHAYEILVDSLLQLPAYGERWTAMWMDLARYADSKGYERDYIRSIFRYRDWLINAFNQDKPYDHFITEQLAGDLLPNPSDEQFLATAFHRNTMNNDEGGTDNEEFRTAAIIDRVNTTWETLLGTSFACVQCHSHPYDPFRHEEYYSFMAFFNNSRDEDTYDEYPLLREFRNNSIPQYDSVITWLQTKADPSTKNFYKTLVKTGQQCINSLTADSLTNAALEDTKFLRMRKNAWARIKSVGLTDKQVLYIRFRSPVKSGQLDFYVGSGSSKPFASTQIKQTKDGWTLISIPIEQKLNGRHDILIHFDSPLLKNENENGPVFDWFCFAPAFPGANDPSFLTYFQTFVSLLNRPDAELTPIMMDNPSDLKRNTYVFERGNWLLKTKLVEAGIPSIFNPQQKQYRNRLDLARWMTDKQNPLTSRTMVNRLWEQLFGQGIVETLEDFGSQGALPSHQQLLDYLSYQFMHEDQWSIKKTLKRMVMSATYRQSSIVDKKTIEKDPLNKFYARAPRVRLSAEQIRDQALVICGAYSNKMFGPSVMPYQPDGIWASPYDGRTWEQSKGEDLYRRAIYTYWKRTGPYPTQINFDGTAREVCVSRRIRTNTPLQALNLLNDSTYWDLSVKFAQNIISKYPTNLEKGIVHAYETAVGNAPDPSKVKFLKQLYWTSFQSIQNNPEKTNAMLNDSSLHKTHALAAMAITANAILNLDEVITKN